MNFCRKKDGKYVCTANKPRLCEHSTMEHWECFCQWCNHPDICGIGSMIFDAERWKNDE